MKDSLFKLNIFIGYKRFYYLYSKMINMMLVRTYNVAINNLRFLLSESHSLTCN